MGQVLGIETWIKSPPGETHEADGLHTSLWFSATRYDISSPPRSHPVKPCVEAGTLATQAIYGYVSERREERGHLRISRVDTRLDVLYPISTASA